MPEEDLIHEQQAEKRSHRRLLWTFVGLALAILVGAPLVWSWSVTRKWERLKAEYAAEGETLEAAELVTEKVPDEENVFGLDELYAGSPTTLMLDTSAVLETLEYAFRIVLEDAERPYRGNFEKAYTHVVADNPMASLPAVGPDAPKALIVGIDKRVPWISKILERIHLPKAVYKEDILKSDPFELRNSASLLRIRGIACLHADDPEQLFAHLRLQMAFLKAELQHPFGINSHDGWLDLLWLALAEGRLAEHHCSQLQAELGRFDVAHGCLRMLRWEAFSSVAGVEELGAGSAAPIIRPLLYLSPVKDMLRFESLKPVASAISALRARGLGSAFGRVASTTTRSRFDQFLLSWSHKGTSALMMPEMAEEVSSNLVDNSVILQTKLDLAKIAVAAELYRFRYGSYPDSAVAMVPEFLPFVPLDLVDGKPLRYRRDGSRYRIWSIWRNIKDDDGTKFGVDGHGHPLHGDDWVWLYPEIPEPPNLDDSISVFTPAPSPRKVVH